MTDPAPPMRPSRRRPPTGASSSTIPPSTSPTDPCSRTSRTCSSACTRAQTSARERKPDYYLAHFDQVGHLDGAWARFGRTYTGEPDVIAHELGQDAAVAAADTLLPTVPNQLGVEYNARLLKTIVDKIAFAIGWRPTAEAA